MFDSHGASAVQRFVLAVAGGSQAPYFVGLLPSRAGTEGTPISFTVDVVDPAGHGVLVTADNLPPGATFDPQTDLFTWTPSYTQAGTYPGAVFTVTDGTLVSHARSSSSPSPMRRSR